MIQKFHFHLKHYNIYFPTLDGLLIYNMKNLRGYISTPDNFNDNCIFGFSKIVKIENNIIAMYGDVYKMDCKTNLYGISVLKLNY